jgi:hypothetical protein
MERRSNPRLWVLLLLRTAGQSRGLRQRGFSMAAVLLVLLVAVVGASSLALRGSSGISGISGTLQLSASRQAREAAENGITEIVAELNRPQNRRLLVSGSSPNAWGSSTDINQRNPCENRTATPQPPLGSATTAGNNLWKSAGGNGEYILRSVRYANRDRSARLAYRYATAGSGAASTTEDVGGYNNNDPAQPDADVNLDPVATAGTENIGHLQLEVQGRVQRAGRTLATATVVKEYQVIPKCCERSYAGPSIAGTPRFSFGNDQRNCPGADLGMIFGFNGGTIDVSGSAGLLLEVSDTGTATGLEAVLCITSSPTASNCVPPSSDSPIPVSGGSVPVIPTIFDVDPPPTFGGTGTTTGIITGSGYYRPRADGTDIERCTATVSGGTISLPSCSNVNFCERVTGSSVADYHCRMNRIRITGGSDNLYFDTSRGTIALFFDEPSSASSSGTFYVGGSSRLYHRFCSTPPTGATGCSTVAPAGQFTRLSFFGSRNHNDFTFLGGGESSSLFIYFPNGTVQIGGSATARGAIWTNNLQLNGNFTSASPAANCATASSGFCFILRGSQATGAGGASATIFDWVARSPVTTRVY